MPSFFGTRSARQLGARRFASWFLAWVMFFTALVPTVSRVWAAQSSTSAPEIIEICTQHGTEYITISSETGNQKPDSKHQPSNSLEACSLCHLQKNQPFVLPSLATAPIYIPVFVLLLNESVAFSPLRQVAYQSPPSRAPPTV